MKRIITDPGINMVPQPRRALYRLHLSEHILITRCGDRVKREVHHIDLLNRGAERETWRYVERVVPQAVRVRLCHFGQNRRSTVQGHRRSQIRCGRPADTCRELS